MDDEILCIPQKYVVKTSEASMPPGNYDPEGGGYDISLIFNADELVALIEGYRSVPRSSGIPGFQPMYVMLSRPSGPKNILSIPADASSLESMPQLLRLEKDAFAWEVAEKRDKGYLHWGHCSDTLDSDNSFDCIRDLAVVSLTMSYVVHQQNLKLFSAIDDFLAEKVDSWKCNFRH